MIRIIVDNQVSEMREDPAKKIREALSDILSTLPTNRIVTEILMDGEQISQTEDKNLDSDLGNVKELSIRTADKEIWETNGLEIAQTSVERIQQSLVRAAQLLREERKGEANRFFMRCIEGLERFIETIAITRHALQLDFETITIDSVSLARTETQFMNILKSILRSQEERDLDSIADKVEYELIPNLGFWSKAIQQLRCARGANA